MRDEKHREHSIEAYEAYINGTLDVTSYNLSEYGGSRQLPSHEGEQIIYVLRLGENAGKHASIAAIPNRLDVLHVLYIGGHESGKSTGRYNVMLDACRTAERFFQDKGYVENDKDCGHSVAGRLTTSLLEQRFTISDCILDLVVCNQKYDELELIIGYQERYHHLPPWNAHRGGASAYEVWVRNQGG